LNPNPKIPDYTHFDGVDEYDRQLNADLFREFREVRAEMNKRVAGTYTPTDGGFTRTNIDALTFYPCQYLRQDKVVTVSGRVDADATAGAATAFRLTLPIASNLANTYELAGTAVVGGFAGMSAAVNADTTNHCAVFNYIANDISNRSFYFTFTYQIL
jgi:hypothetical protein